MTKPTSKPKRIIKGKKRPFSLLTNHEDKYKIKLILASSEGWKEINPRSSHLLAPRIFWLYPGIRTIIKVITETTKVGIARLKKRRKLIWEKIPRSRKPIKAAIICSLT